MALDAFVVLESLHCTSEVEFLPMGSEPYIWPVLVRIDDLTLQTESLVDVVEPLLVHARVVIQREMRAGQSADIPTSVGVLRVRLEANVFVTRLILVVALWEGDETPEAAMRAGYQAFVSELGAALGNVNTLLALKDADERKDAEALKAIVATIKSQVESRVKSAISNGLTGWQKVAVATGFLNLDDPIGNAFRAFPNALPTPITLNFGKAFEIRGRLEAREVLVDGCQAQVKAVRDAQSVVDQVAQQIRRLGDELRHAPPQAKPFILAEIKRTREEDLAIALAALGEARTALSICRSTKPGLSSGTVLASASG